MCLETNSLFACGCKDEQHVETCDDLPHRLRNAEQPFCTSWCSNYKHRNIFQEDLCGRCVQNQCFWPGCQECFPTKIELVAHLRSGHNWVAWKCPFQRCKDGFVYAKKTDLEVHFKVYHSCDLDDQVVASLKNVPFRWSGSAYSRCLFPGCAEVSKNLDLELQHIASEHKVWKLWNCFVAGCGLPFQGKHSLRRHLISKHGWQAHWGKKMQNRNDCFYSSCRQPFRSQKSLLRHLGCCHDEWGPWACPFSECTGKHPYETKGFLNLHIDHEHSHAEGSKDGLMEVLWDDDSDTSEASDSSGSDVEMVKV